MSDHKAAMEWASNDYHKHGADCPGCNLAACYIEQAAQLGAAEAKFATIEAVMPRIIRLLTDTINEHRTSTDPFYNNCDQDECNWCTTAREVIRALKESAATQETATVQCISGGDTLTEREVPIAAPSFVWGPESQSYTGGPICRVGTSSGAVTAALQDKYEDFHPKELDAPTDEQGQYFCNKCGYFGPRGPRHCRPTTNEECGYHATFHAPADEQGKQEGLKRLEPSVMFTGPNRSSDNELIAQGMERAAEICKRKAEERFMGHGTYEDDTGAAYYTGSCADEYEIRDEEDENCAAVIRAEAARMSDIPESKQGG